MAELKENILSISELTNSIKSVLENEFEKVSVIGEISNFKPHVSGHWYFNLKDENASINCTMWKGLNNYVFFTPQDGLKVLVTGRITVYPPRGSYQLDVRSMKPAGEGELQAAFERLKKKLQNEGLFDPELKKPITTFPNKIAIITAEDGAALRDMISVAKRRFPLIKLVLAPSRVQGSGAAENIAENIKKLNLIKDIDVILLARGGGSIEDLWAFNEEIVARAIFKSKIPIISGIGHEIDFTIADFVADLRAPTPSVAMELVTPDQVQITNWINDFILDSHTQLKDRLESIKHDVEHKVTSYSFRYPLEKVRMNSQKIDFMISGFFKIFDSKFLRLSRKLIELSAKINFYDTEKTLKKGFVLIKQKNKFVTRKKNYDFSESSQLKFFDGEIIIKNQND